MYSLEGIVLIQSSWNFVWMCDVIKSRPEFKIGHVGSKTRSLGQFLEKPCVLSRRHRLDPVFMKLCQNDFLTLNKHLSRRAMLSDDSSCCARLPIVLWPWCWVHSHLLSSPACTDCNVCLRQVWCSIRFNLTLGISVMWNFLYLYTHY